MRRMSLSPDCVFLAPEGQMVGGGRNSRVAGATLLPNPAHAAPRRRGPVLADRGLFV